MGRLDEIDARLDELRREGVYNSREINELREERSGLGVPTLKEEGTLGKMEWTWVRYGRSAGSSVTLQAVERGYSDDNIERVHRIMHFGYHSNADLEEGVNLRVNDGEVDLYFKTVALMADFVKRWGITKIDWSYIRYEREKLIKELRAWDDILANTTEIQPPGEFEDMPYYDYDDPHESPYKDGGPPTPCED